MAQQGGNCRKIHAFDQAPCGIVTESVGVNMRDISATTEHSQQVSRTAIRVGPALTTETGPSATAGRIALTASRTCVHWNDARFVAFTSCYSYERCSRARRRDQVGPGQTDELVHAQARVRPGSDNGVRYGSGPLGFAAESLTLVRLCRPRRDLLLRQEGEKRRHCVIGGTNECLRLGP